MPETLPAIAVSESEVWAALQLDLEPSDTSPPEYAPVDADFVRTLIVNAEARISRFCGFALTDLEAVPAELTQAVILDCMIHYFDRMNPVLPDLWDELIRPYRRWGFGGAVVEEGASDEA